MKKISIIISAILLLGIIQKNNNCEESYTHITDSIYENRIVSYQSDIKGKITDLFYRHKKEKTGVITERYLISE